MTNSPSFTPVNTATTFNQSSALARVFVRGARRNSLLPANGDGSTLSLDFTTGVLDPRLTFTRDSNATFINSSGLVQYADANMMRNSSWSDSNPVPAQWSGAGNTPTIPATGSRTFTVSTAAFSYIAEGGAGATGSQGLVYTAAVEVTAVSGSPTYNNTILATASPTGVSWYRNGTPVNGTDAVQTGVIAYVFTSGNGSFVRVGLGASGGSVTNQSITMTKPRLMPGNRVDSPYFPSASATNQYQAPRFDYDPTTLSPRGLLIEGAANNTISNSNTIYTGAWGGSVGITATQDTTILDPSGGTTTCKIVKASPNQYVVRNQPIPTLTVPANSTVSLTISVWLRMDGANQVAASLGIYDTAGASFGTRSGASVSNSAVTISSGSSADAEFTFGTVTGWVRCSISRSFTNATASPISFSTLQFYIYPNRLNTNATTIYAWGAQAETGIGPSSLIPTGASTGNRQADNCSIVSPNFAPWFNASAGTLLVSARTATRYVDSAGFDFPAVLTLDSNNHIGPCQWNGVVYGVVRVGGSYRINYATLASPGNNANYKAAIAYADSDYAAVANGGSIQTGSGTTVPSGLNQLALGASRAGIAGNFFGHISQIKFWPTRLPNAQLQSLTT